MNRENYFISTFTSRVIGDDGALLDGYVYSKDAFFENVHFKREWMSLEEIAYKSMMVNISDAIAMNAIPKYALLAVAFPKSFLKKDILALNRGFEKAAKEYGIEIIGGDTIANMKLDISVTLVSKTKRALLRKGLKENHLVAYTGKLGLVKKDLRYLLAGGKIHKKSPFVSFNLRQSFIAEVTPYLSSGMDISDGLFRDIKKLTDMNRVGVKFSKKITKAIGCSGEEYEMLVSFSPRYRKKMMRLAKIHRTPLTIFASAKRLKYRDCCKANHF